MEPEKNSMEERLARVEQKLHDLKTYIMNDTKADIEKLEEKFEKMEKREQSQFRWTMTTLLTIFAIILSLFVALCVR